jgi:hypothetical protein
VWLGRLGVFSTTPTHSLFQCADTGLLSLIDVGFAFVCVVGLQVHKSITIFIIAVLGVLAVYILIRLGRIYRFGHKLMSYSHGCHLLLLAWCTLRITLLALYAEPESISHHSVADNLQELPYMLLYVAPPILQFLTFSLLALYFTQVCIFAMPTAHRSRWNKLSVMVCITINAMVGVLGVLGAVHFHRLTDVTSQKSQSGIKNRVVISEIFSLILCLVWVGATLKIHQLIQTKKIIEGAGLTLRQVILVTSLIVFLLCTRLIFNVIAVAEPQIPSWDFDLSFLSDHADRAKDESWAFVFFVVAMFFWEVIPSVLVVYFFIVPVVDVAGLKEIQNMPYETEPMLFNDADSLAESDDSMDGGTFVSGRDGRDPSYEFWPSASLGRDAINTSRSSYYDTGPSSYITPPSSQNTHPGAR